MEPTVLTIHIISFSMSLLLFPVLAVAAIAKYHLPRIVKVSSLSLTGIGLATGIGLLVAHPAGSRCLMLTTYLISFIALYRAAASVPTCMLAKEATRR